MTELEGCIKFWEAKKKRGTPGCVHRGYCRQYNTLPQGAGKNKEVMIVVAYVIGFGVAAVVFFAAAALWAWRIARGR